MLRRGEASLDGRKPLRTGECTEGTEEVVKTNGASGIQPAEDRAFRYPNAEELTAGSGPGDKGFLRTLVIRNEIDDRSESRGINNKGINDTDKYVYRSSPQLEDCKGPDASNLFIDQCLNVINSWLVNYKY